MKNYSAAKGLTCHSLCVIQQNLSQCMRFPRGGKGGGGQGGGGQGGARGLNKIKHGYVAYLIDGDDEQAECK